MNNGDSEKKQLIKDRRIFSALIENSSDFIGIADKEGKPIYVNPAGRRMVGMTEDFPIESTQIPEYYPPEERAFASEVIVKSMIEKGHWHGEAYFRNWQTQESIPVSDTHFMIRELETGEILGMGTITRNITERKKAEQEIKQQKELFESVLLNMTEGISVITSKKEVIILNQQAQEIPGVAWPDSNPNRWAEQFGVFFPDKSRMLQTEELPAIRALNGETVKDLELLIVNPKNRTERFVLVNSKPIINDNGKVEFAVSSFRDITERKKLETSLAAQTRELARSNAELEQFAYVTSHDLREPLRMITNYAQLLEKRYKGKLDESADKFIGYMVEGVNQMQLLISDLLTYSKVGRADSPVEEIEMTALTHGVLKNLQAAIKESKANIIIDPLPTIQANRLLISQLIQNLLSNAIKFCKKDVSPQVRVSSKRENKEWIFSVSDNGIGIEPQYADRIFIIFQRLHSRTEYAGTGIGLAICKKIVDRHGGKIWMESTPGQGSTFYFSVLENKGNTHETKTS